MEDQVSTVTIISVQSHQLCHVFMVKQNFIINRIKHIGKSSWVNVNAMQYTCPAMQKRLHPTKRNIRLLVLCRLQHSHHFKLPSQPAKFQRKALFFSLKDDTLLLLNTKIQGTNGNSEFSEQFQQMLRETYLFSYFKTRLTCLFLSQVRCYTDSQD